MRPAALASLAPRDCAARLRHSYAPLFALLVRAARTCSLRCSAALLVRAALCAARTLLGSLAATHPDSLAFRLLGLDSLPSHSCGERERSTPWGTAPALAGPREARVGRARTQGLKVRRCHRGAPGSYWKPLRTCAAEGVPMPSGCLAAYGFTHRSQRPAISPTSPSAELSSGDGGAAGRPPRARTVRARRAHRWRLRSTGSSRPALPSACGRRRRCSRRRR
ncbi:MAG: hypothetical protein JWP01_3745 [Myxococcales bacterium]|nr:hypothetical protein [Myxococcales bacterium]